MLAYTKLFAKLSASCIAPKLWKTWVIGKGTMIRRYTLAAFVEPVWT